MNTTSGKQWITKGILLAPALVLGACASSGQARFSDNLRAEGSHMNGIAERWEEGHEQMSKGEKMRDQARDDLKESEAAMRKGDSRVNTARAQIEGQQSAYRAAVRVLGGASTPKDVRKEADKLEDIASRWEDGLEMLEDGTELAEEGRAGIREAELKMAESGRLIESGRQKMQASELAYRATVNPHEPAAKAPRRDVSDAPRPLPAQY